MKMIKIDVVSGFLGAGKTTLIKKLLSEALQGTKTVLIENEFGQIGIDGGFLKDAGIEITEMNSGCICCSLVGDFTEALGRVLSEFKPDRIVIEPSGVGKLSDVVAAVGKVTGENATLGAKAVVVDAGKAKMYIKNFGEFFCDQIEHADTVILSHTKSISDERISECINLIKNYNKDATIVATEWEELTGLQLLDAMEKKNLLHHHIHSLEEACHEHHHDKECECGCGCSEDCDCGCQEGGEYHCHDEDCDCGCHHEHHEHHHDEECECGCHHEHHNHHHADEVFSSVGFETAKRFSPEFIKNALNELANEEKYGMVLRVKGMVAASDGGFIHFDYVPDEPDVRKGSSDIIGRVCVIGSKLNKTAVLELFGV